MEGPGLAALKGPGPEPEGLEELGGKGDACGCSSQERFPGRGSGPGLPWAH